MGNLYFYTKTLLTDNYIYNHRVHEPLILHPLVKDSNQVSCMEFLYKILQAGVGSSLDSIGLAKAPPIPFFFTSELTHQTSYKLIT